MMRSWNPSGGRPQYTIEKCIASLTISCRFCGSGADTPCRKIGQCDQEVDELGVHYVRVHDYLDYRIEVTRR
jgi:hypothetical protein